MAAVVGVAGVALANALAVPLALEALVAGHARTRPLLASAAAGRFDADVPWPDAVRATAGLEAVVAAYVDRRCPDPGRLRRCEAPCRAGVAGYLVPPRWIALPSSAAHGVAPRAGASCVLATTCYQ